MDNNINYIAFDFVEENNNEISPNDVEVEIIALDQYRIAKYTFNNALYDFFPEFNEGYIYTYEDVVEENVTTRTIYSNELPTLIRFGVLWRADDNYGDEKWNNSLLEVEYINTTNIIDASNLFTRNVNMNKINNFNITNKTTVLNEVFLSCHSLTSLDVSNWDVSNVTNMNSLFNSCTNLESIKGLENWDVRKVYYMTNLFSQCSKLKSLNISNWHLNSEVNVTDMFTVTNALTNVIMNNSDYNSVNKVITALPTRTSDSMGTLNVVGVDDFSQVDIATAQSKFWNVVNLKRYKVHLISINNNKINKVHNLNKKLKISFYK